MKMVTFQRSLCAFVALGGLGVLTACNPPSNDQQLKEQAAQATAQAKQGAKEGLAQARVAASNAEQAVNDVASGVKQGIHDKTPGSVVDLNSAPEADLAALPGISASKAKQIVRRRPYSSTHDLVSSGILTESQYNAIDPKVTVH
jgi:DNA uptake protein ComE-like DNA-binding protein